MGKKRGYIELLWGDVPWNLHRTGDRAQKLGLESALQPLWKTKETATTGLIPLAYLVARLAAPGPDLEPGKLPGNRIRRRDDEIDHESRSAIGHESQAFQRVAGRLAGSDGDRIDSNAYRGDRAAERPQKHRPCGLNRPGNPGLVHVQPWQGDR